MRSPGLGTADKQLLRSRPGEGWWSQSRTDAKGLNGERFKMLLRPHPDVTTTWWLVTVSAWGEPGCSPLFLASFSWGAVSAACRLPALVGTTGLHCRTMQRHWAGAFSVLLGRAVIGARGLVERGVTYLTVAA